MGFFGPINGAGAGFMTYGGYMYSGAGFGAGGGAVMHNGNSYDASSYNASGGNAGEVVFGSYTLSSSATIAITVGTGGVPSNYAGTYAASGADGCVAVFW